MPTIFQMPILGSLCFYCYIVSWNINHVATLIFLDILVSFTLCQAPLFFFLSTAYCIFKRLPKHCFLCLYFFLKQLQRLPIGNMIKLKFLSLVVETQTISLQIYHFKHLLFLCGAAALISCSIYILHILNVPAQLI